MQLISRKLQREGITVGNFDWSITVEQRVGRPQRSNAAHIAQYGLDIPIHQNMPLGELQRISAAIATA
jgi:hypothetical protein